MTCIINQLIIAVTCGKRDPFGSHHAQLINYARLHKINLAVSLFKKKLAA